MCGCDWGHVSAQCVYSNESSMKPLGLEQVYEAPGFGLVWNVCVAPQGTLEKGKNGAHVCMLWHEHASCSEPCIRLRKRAHMHGKNTQQVSDSLRVPVSLFQQLLSMDMLYTQQVFTSL